MSVTNHSQAVPRTAALDSNLKEQLKWLSQNLTGAYYSGFNYAPKASEDFVVPTVFNFDNHSRRASNNSTLASLSEVGDFELQSFRAKNSFLGTSSNFKTDLQSSFVGSSSSARPSVPSPEGDGQNLTDGYDNGFPSSYSTRRPSVGSFLGPQGASKSYQHAGHANNINSAAGRTYNDSTDRSSSNSNNGSKFGGQGGGNQNNGSNDWHQSHSHSGSRGNIDYNNNRNYNELKSSSAANSDFSNFPMDISDSQLAGLDIDG